MRAFHCGEFRLPLGGRTYVMGILNVTPDSFSDGGRYPHAEAAVRHARAMVAAGADLIDIGGESTRPGHEPVSEAEELKRVLPVLERLESEPLGVPLSIDTQKPAVAEAALACGCTIVNDVWGLQRQVELARLAATHGAGVVAMHNHEGTDYPDLFASMEALFERTIDIAGDAGLPRDALVLDPGIGFGKTVDHNFAVLGGLRRLSRLGPLLVGPSRKSFLGAATGKTVEQRLLATAAAVALAVSQGADIVRVHDVPEMVDVVRVADRAVRS